MREDDHVQHADAMQDEFDRYLVRAVACILGFLMLVCAMVAIDRLVLAAPAPPRASREFTEEERAWVKKRHAFHGITSSVVDEATGERYFYRDGQRCAL